MEYLLKNYEEIESWHRLPFYKKWFTDKPEKDLTTEYINEYIDVRRAGNTTRYANRIVENVLRTKTVRVADHFQSSAANKRLLGIVMRRLRDEHGVLSSDIDIERVVNTNCFQPHTYYIIRIK